ncbi:facilitated trehalose transporter Tret1-2 homolog isoform X4 [Macrosteles quadrilineatus]|uniref:facilitated trehalose transporter Tret1-2 homolog isoform X4 n=1 Tax=Macrosteles quadrilineatus TaxID=74068 RepID=UPI0023E0A686|nr:facilitated trehalose transporter Tret1-2 homolog isoform X4 [Macrosteles quadrilineatus]
MTPTPGNDTGEMTRARRQLTASSDYLSEDELQIIERGGGRLFSSHHRPRPSIVSSATSSAASVATSGGSTTALIKQKRRQGYFTRAKPRMDPGQQKELNLLLARPQVPEITEKVGAKAEEMVNFVDDKPEEPASQTVINVDDQEGHTYVPQVLAAISVSLGSMIVGFVSSYTSPAIPSMKDQPGALGHITENHESWIGSLLPLFAIFGGMIGGPAIDRIGRKTTILLTAFPFLLSFMLIAFAMNIGMVYAGRCIAGFCTGIITLALPVYLGETIQSEVRGILGLLPTSVGNLGILVCFFSGKYLNWSNLALVGAAIPIPFIICMFLIPETPRWYIGKEKKKRARKALQWLRGRYTDVSQEFSEIEKNHHESQLEDSNPGLGELFSRRYAKPLVISMGLMLFQQMSGINAVMFYTVDIFKASKSSIDNNLCTIIIALVNLVTVFVSSALIDRLGRKILLYLSGSLMTVTITSLGIYFYFREYTSVDMDHLGWIPLVSFIVYIIGFSIGFGPIPWLMMGEILPARIRGSAASIATSFNWFTTFFITKTFKDFGSQWGYSMPFLMYGACCFISLFFVFYCVPETQGKSLEDIERNLIGEGPKIPVRTARRMSSIANLKPTPIAI